ncbi:MAG TPA: tyrosine-type recombinase/integrase [Gemmataceae bacterium]|nr:tyrosine-type recombinase/integrase [Gemmataceae bacterium]
MQEAEGKSLVVVKPKRAVQLVALRLVSSAGEAGRFAWEEFFKGKIRNPHTRAAYLKAVRQFLCWCEPRAGELRDITPGMIGDYLDELKLAVPSKKVHLAGIRTFFDVLVQRHVIVLNPAHSVKTERYSAMEGRTPEISVGQAQTLLASIKVESVIDYRDRTLIAVLIYTAARAGAVAKLRLGDLLDDGRRCSLRFTEKGGKARTIPVNEKLETYLSEYLSVAGFNEESKASPLFRTAGGRKLALSTTAMNGVDVCRMVKRRLKAAGLPTSASPHSFRACVATDLLSQNVALEDVQYLLGHSDSRVTKLYDRRQKQVTRNIVEKISV